MSSTTSSTTFQLALTPGTETPPYLLPYDNKAIRQVPIFDVKVRCYALFVHIFREYCLSPREKGRFSLLFTSRIEKRRMETYLFSKFWVVAQSDTCSMDSPRHQKEEPKIEARRSNGCRSGAVAMASCSSRPGSHHCLLQRKSLDCRQ